MAVPAVGYCHQGMRRNGSEHPRGGTWFPYNLLMYWRMNIYSISTTLWYAQKEPAWVWLPRSYFFKTIAEAFSAAAEYTACQLVLSRSLNDQSEVIKDGLALAFTFAVSVGWLCVQGKLYESQIISLIFGTDEAKEDPNQRSSISSIWNDHSTPRVVSCMSLFVRSDTSHNYIA